MTLNLFTLLAPCLLQNSTWVNHLMMRGLFLAVLFVVPMSVTEAAVEERQSEFQKLEQQFQQAKTKLEFTEVATAYESLIGPTTPSASVLFNQANAWFKAGEIGRAIAGYRQAIKLQPSDNAIRSNLKLALVKANHAEQKTKAMDYAFFWNQQFTSSTIAMLITVIIVVAAVLFLLNSNSPLCRTGFRIFAALAAVLIVSFVFKVNDEELTDRGVVVVESSDAKKGPAASYESAYSSALSDGQEFIVIDQQQDWLQVDIAGIGSGWLPASDVLLY